MYKQHQDFLEWAAAYDTGDVNMRSKGTAINGRSSWTAVS